MPKDFWKRVVFSDESIVQFNTKKQKQWILKDQKPDPVERDQWQAQILTWEAIKYNETSDFEIVNGTIKSQDYLNILKRKLLRNLPQLRESSPLDLESDSNFPTRWL